MRMVRLSMFDLSRSAIWVIASREERRTVQSSRSAGNRCSTPTHRVGKSALKLRVGGDPLLDHLHAQVTDFCLVKALGLRAYLEITSESIRWFCWKGALDDLTRAAPD